MENHKELSLLGLASRAGRLVSGEFQTEKSVKTGKACLVILAGDASYRTKKKFKDMCAYYRVECSVISTDKESLGSRIGRGSRSCLAIEDRGLAEALKSKPGIMRIDVSDMRERS